MSLQREAALATGVAVYAGKIYVADVSGGNFTPTVCTIGLSLDGKTGVAKTVADLLIALSATTIKNCDVASRFLQPTYISAD
jgi:glycerol uptake facilitator-like aquaporin